MKQQWNEVAYLTWNSVSLYNIPTFQSPTFALPETIIAPEKEGLEDFLLNSGIARHTGVLLLLIFQVWPNFILGLIINHASSISR